ncbi:MULTISPECIES: SLC13 family permease [unclassified Sphingomonas]|uniref:SLC13 family permease n=1 Tax=unclassified Sphingomonas TaxID=196159 RepID=UPI0006F8C50F|nr:MULTISPECIES: SLC13 family permease [unclassified Sphingomonas]KQX20066.1 citrate transporter [Sphingomonas sp. Root1294]KQY67316.1 citrate transporter [Sphingomonas sp. Root50]KRB90691.1 citrate transporter [Sphingomonas sp. Root720]
MTPAALSALILGITLVLFVSEKVRHDLVALIALFACLAVGLVTPAKAFLGFADPAVLAVAAVLVVGRAVELSGVASAMAKMMIPEHAGFVFRLTALLAVAMLLSAFMNNIAALVITMPIATEIARDSRLPPTATLMPLAFATILGGMTTLIGTPANLILSSVRETEIGAPFGFFTMTPVGVAVSLLGLVYLAWIGWRLLPIRRSAEQVKRPPWRVFELTVPLAEGGWDDLLDRLRGARARLLAQFREGAASLGALRPGDRLLVMSRANQWTVAERTGLETAAQLAPAADAVTARVAVAHGSLLINLGYDQVRTQTDDQIEVVAVGPRVAREKQPLVRMRIRAGDQLYLRGRPDDLARFIARARLLEIDRLDPVPVAPARSAAILAIFGISIAAIVIGGLSPAIAFLGAAALLAGLRLLPAEEIYRSIDWTVIVLLAAMIPVGQSFDDSGAAAIAAQWLGSVLADLPLVAVLAVLCAVTMLLSIFLNNVATAVIMGPLAIDVARLLGVSPDAALLAVLIGASSDFLTPIGHQNNLLVMGPGGYRFTDYARMGAALVVIVVATAAVTLGFLYR